MSSSSLASRSRVAGVCARANSAHPSLSSRVSPSLFRSLNVSVKVSGPTHRSPSPPLPLLHSTHSADAPRVFQCVTLIGSLYNVYIERERAKEREREREKVNYITPLYDTLMSLRAIASFRLLSVYHPHISLTSIWPCRLFTAFRGYPSGICIFQRASGPSSFESCRSYFSLSLYFFLFYLSISLVLSFFLSFFLSLSCRESDTHESSSHAYT